MASLTPTSSRSSSPAIPVTETLQEDGEDPLDLLIRQRKYSQAIDFIESLSLKEFQTKLISDYLNVASDIHDLFKINLPELTKGNLVPAEEEAFCEHIVSYVVEEESADKYAFIVKIAIYFMRGEDSESRVASFKEKIGTQIEEKSNLLLTPITSMRNLISSYESKIDPTFDPLKEAKKTLAILDTKYQRLQAFKARL